jgi:hypothetical protein
VSGDGGAKIVVSGHGTLNADVIAVGYQARAEKAVHEAGDALKDRGLDEIRAKLDTLMASVAQHSQKLADPEAVNALTERVAAELKQPKPDKFSLRAFLGNIAENAKSVGDIAAAATGLMALIAAVF